MVSTTSTTKPGRPLGLSLAILTSVFLFTFVPLVQVYFLLHLREAVVFASDEGMSGISITGMSDVTLYAQTLLGLLFLLIAVFAWRGRPPSVRFVMLGAVVALTAVTITLSILPLLNPPPCDLTNCDSSGDVSRSIAWARLCFTLLIPLYVVWYVNRAPARAFFRGYYLPLPKDAAETSIQMP